MAGDAKYQGIIMAVRKNGVVVADPDLPTEFGMFTEYTYDFQLVNEPDSLRGEDVAPSHRRITELTEITPAKLGDACDVYVQRGAVLLHVIEGIYAEPCT